jgi:type II restriction/modification system DNA methylase subunit YeeA
MNATGILKDGEPTHLRLLDPATGSGHILVEGFALLYEMYMEEYYLPVEAVDNILTKNLLGLEPDLRATQLAFFASCWQRLKKSPES